MQKKIFTILFLITLVFLLNSVSYAVSPVVTPISSYAITEGGAARIASNSAGKLYVTVPSRGRIDVYSNNGALLRSLQGGELPLSPYGIAVDEAGGILISDIRKNFVGVYDGSGALFFKLGSGNGEFFFPSGISLSKNSGNIFVTDSLRNEVRVYSSAGVFLSSFGSDLLRYPTGIFVDDSSGEVYVLDFKNLYVRIYDLQGNLKRSIRGRGGMMGGGKLQMPSGIYADGSRLYIADAFFSALAVYDKTLGTFLNYIGGYGSNLGEYKIPTDMTLDRDGKMFVVNSNNQRIEVLGLDSFLELKIAPEKLNFSVYRGGESVTQTVDLTSNMTNVAWEASVSGPAAPWITLPVSSGTAPSSFAVTVTPSDIPAGTYPAEIAVKILSSGTVLSVPLVVEVKIPELFVSPSSLMLVYQKGATVTPAGSIMISSTATGIPWSATTSSWLLMLDKTSGKTPGSLQVRFSNTIKNLKPGSYNAPVTINAGDITGSPFVVNVRLDIIRAGDIQVKTNLEAAAFTITGPKTFSGAGTGWYEKDVPEGKYSISYGHVSGYRRPPQQSFTVRSGEAVSVNGIYNKKPLAGHLVVGSNDPAVNMLGILTLEGVPVLYLAPFAGPAVVKVAAGDINGDGVDEIIVTNGKNIIKVFSADGKEIAVQKFPFPYENQNLEITVSDIDNDGKSEIIASFYQMRRTSLLIYKVISGKFQSYRSVIVQNGGNSALPASLFLGFQSYRSVIVQNGTGPVTVAAGDVNGDGLLDLIVADRFYVGVYNLNTLRLIWSKRLNERVRPNIATGDLNNDGLDEVCLASGPDPSNSPVVRCLKNDGSDYMPEFSAFEGYGYKYGAGLSLGDTTGDGFSEIAVGAGPDPEAETLLSLFGNDGRYLNTMNALNGFYGLNISFGNFTQ